MKFSLLATAAALIVGASAHMEQLESGLIDYYWLKGSDGSAGQWLSFNSTSWQSLSKPDSNGPVVYITSPEQFKSIQPTPENGLFSVPKNTRISDLAVYYDHEAKDDKKDDKKPGNPVEFPTFTCILKLCRNSN
ncbi:hypothetical protein DFQ28_003622 [Apophysomyces sp. BC1034]|nr:hypothetical protein DFQ30_010407 [Apophysomyces sp. BC1015]KAG0179159.1 hypothetical protein DFQ29_002446 [Apophysomyces sp. BC1021]KAG0189274.1 hypothetical protein DFQ28_003622 [Apophysomyces sp. BC1034]